MLIKVNDKVEVRPVGGGITRDGVITNISIGLTKSDPAGELGISLDQYDTDMGYLGSISYKDTTFDGDHGEKWAYFDQIVVNKR